MPTPLPLVLGLLSALSPQLPERPVLQPLDVFELEHAEDPQLSPDGARVVYVRAGFDVMTDRARRELWTVDFDGGHHLPLVTEGDPSGPRWSPDGTRLAFVARTERGAQVVVRWMDGGQQALATHVREAPAHLAWSPDGRWIAFDAFVPAPEEPFCALPKPPEGATWAPTPKVVRTTHYRQDGAGYLRAGARQVFVAPSDGGTARALTEGPHDCAGPFAWTPDGAALLFSANRRDDAELEPSDSEVWRVDVESGALSALTSRYGPDTEPVLSPDGATVATLGYEDEHLGFQADRIWLLDPGGGAPRPVPGPPERDLSQLAWPRAGLTFLYDDQGDTKLGRVDARTGESSVLAEHLGGTSLGRPYSGATFSCADDGRFATVVTAPDRPADVLVGGDGGPPRRVTDLNADLLAARRLGRVEELRVTSSADELEVQGWIVWPPDFDAQDATRQWPLLLEIHGGPFANYGPRFAAEMQLYAAAGYVVLYANPRGSTSYGAAFANEIHHAYPGRDYDDLMSCVDALLATGRIDPEHLYVTGGSGGGVLTAWIVGRTDRFRAAVVAKPVIDWTSFVLTADMSPYFVRNWFPGPPWEHRAHYDARSPLSLVGNVRTPTMLLTGEQDFRTPISQSEEYYGALRLRGVDTVLVRVPEAGHGITARPSHLIAKVAHVLAWFERHR